MTGHQRSYLVLAPTAWDTPRQPAHNIADALAVHHRVLYVDPPLSPLSPFRYGLREIDRRRLRSVLDRRVREAGDLSVFAPLVLPPIEHPRARALSLPALRSQIAGAARRAGLRSPVVLAWRGLPSLAGAAGESLRVGILMDHPAAGAELLGRDAEELELEAAALCESADVICSTSLGMHELLGERGWPNEHVPFGFPGDLAARYDHSAEPEEYRELPRPILGYTGGIDDRLDFDLVLRLADEFSAGSIVFVGAASPRLSTEARSALASRANIHLLGPRERLSLPGYVRFLDLALMPYRETLFTHYQSPMKMWEYLYAGPPIVATGSTELRSFGAPLVNYSETAAQALAAARSVLEHPDLGREERRRFALANTWDDRAAQLETIVSRALAEDRG